MEALIQIIMDATGFNRDEIQPDMDLRRDLSIRSSRLPIIMDAAERHFGITIELEDFINVRTVRDIAKRISEIVARKEGAGLPPAAKAAEPGLVQDETPEPLQDEASLKRLVFKSVPMELSASAPIKLSQGESVLFLSPDRDDEIARNVGDILRQDYGVDTIPMLFMPGKGAGQEGYDILTDEGSCKGIGENIEFGVPGWDGYHFTQRLVGKVKRHSGCFAAFEGAVFTAEGVSPVAGQEIRRAYSFQRGCRNSRSAAGGGNARNVPERSAGILIGPVSHTGNRRRYRPSRCLTRRSGQRIHRGGDDSS